MYCRTPALLLARSRGSLGQVGRRSSSGDLGPGQRAHHARQRGSPRMRVRRRGLAFLGAGLLSTCLAFVPAVNHLRDARVPSKASLQFGTSAEARASLNQVRTPLQLYGIFCTSLSRVVGEAQKHAAIDAATAVCIVAKHWMITSGYIMKHDGS